MSNELLSFTRFDDTNYSYSHKMFVPGYKNFKLHTHKAYEIYIFLKGNAEYVNVKIKSNHNSVHKSGVFKLFKLLQSIYYRNR